MSEDVKSLAKLAIRQATLISVMSSHLADQACLLASMLKKCQRCYKRPITVSHEKNGEACDRCAAEATTDIHDLISPNSEPGLDKLNVAAGWIDIQDAEKIRRLDDYVSLVKELDNDPTDIEVH